MLRCTLASLLPLMNSKKYGKSSLELFHKYTYSFNQAFKKESYYILRELPEDVLKEFFVQRIPSILEEQKKTHNGQEGLVFF